MKFEVHNLQTVVTERSSAEDAWLRHVLSHAKAIKGYMGITKGYQDLSFYDHLGHCFPSGLLPLVSDMAREKGFDLSFADKRVKPCLPKEVDLLFLKDSIRGRHQTEAIEAGIQWGRGIFWCPTAYGKTQVAIGLAKRLPCKWAFLVDEATLLDQTIDRWNAWDTDNEPAGILGDGKWEDARFVVATYQTIHAKVGDPRIDRWIKSVGGFILDEVHVVSAMTHFATAMRFENAYFRYGISATPLSRGPWENLHVLAATGRVIYKANVPEMVAAGVLSMPVVEMIPFEHKEAMSMSWSGVYSELIVRNPKRNNLIIDKAVASAKPCLIFCTKIAHGEDLLTRALKKGLKAEFLYGEAKLSERKAAIARLVDGKLDTIITNKIFQKGVDIPPLLTIIIAGGGQSVVDSLQRVGRGMRITEGKRAFTVIDFIDRNQTWVYRHSIERKKAYKAAGYIVPDADPRAIEQGVLFTR